MVKDKIEKCEELLSNSKLGTIILAIINLQNEKGYARYGDIFKRVFPNENRINNAKLNYYLDMLKQGIEIPPSDNTSNEKSIKIANIIISEGGGIYKYNKEKIITLFVAALIFSSVDYYKKYKSLFYSEDIKIAIYNYLINYTEPGENHHDWEERDWLNISDIISNMEQHLLIQYYNKQLEKLPNLKRWSKIILELETKDNLFVESIKRIKKNKRIKKEKESEEN